MNYVVELHNRPGVPLYQQVVDAIVALIQAGTLAPGEPLPSTRDMSSAIGVGRVTVIRAYEELQMKGYLHTLPGFGTFVAKDLPAIKSQESSSSVDADKAPQRSIESFGLSTFGTNLNNIEYIGAMLDTPDAGCCPAENLPSKLWRELVSRHTSDQSATGGDVYDFDLLGYRPLREAIAEYLERARNVRCHPDQIAIFQAQLQGIYLLSTLLIEQGTPVAMENPGFSCVRAIFQSVGARVHGLPVDDSGLITEELAQLEEDCRLLFVAPSSQDPTGALLPKKRREEILQWAARRNALVIEDDIDWEYRYGSRSLSSMFGMDGGESVIYFGTFWKTLFPLTTVGFIVAPRGLMSTISRAKALIEPALPMVEQYALTDFIAQGHLERHIKRSRDTFEKRRRNFILAFTKHFAGTAKIPKHGAGLHHLVQFDASIAESKILHAAKEVGLPLTSTKACYAGQLPSAQAPANEFIVSFPFIDSEAVEGQITQFKNALGAE